MWIEILYTAAYLRNGSTKKSLDDLDETDWSLVKEDAVCWLSKDYKKQDYRIEQKRIQRKVSIQRWWVYTGYSEESKTYRLWKPDTKIIIKARDVTFFENIDRQDELLGVQLCFRRFRNRWLWRYVVVEINRQ